MPHKCTRCGKVYGEGSKEILEGCKCGNRYFLYFRKITDEEAEKFKDIWNIKVKDGTYEIDIASLMAKEPIIISGEEGRYLLSLASAFKGKKIKYPDRVKR
jgi:predicted  nucleic acid-binding Zn-ribbon protein